jgi:threonine/homoserine/homoserine lactone efflux protein
MLTAQTITMFVLPYALAAAMPGAAQSVLVARVAAYGPKRTLPFAAGMVAGNAIWLLAAALGLAALAAKFAVVFSAIKWMGLAYLCWMAWKLWTSNPGASAAPAGRTGFLSGAALTLGNPKAVVFYSAVLPQVLDLHGVSSLDLVAIFAIGAFTDACVQGSYILLVGRARRLLAAPHRMRKMNRAAAVTIAGSALAIASKS